ncbi:MAG: glycosyltransferase, partial [Muribaculaceae bacterium]|nr:glycosyltransferase [Muribaculaceae bacterium]
MISILMPAYNSAPWIEGAIRSVMAQSFTDWQLIVVDDGSSDATPLIVNSLAQEDARISLLTTDHLGVANARNVGLDNIRGDRVAFIDSDDLWPPFSLEALAEMMERFDADITAGNFIQFDDEKETPPKPLSNHRKYLADNKIMLLSGEDAVEDSLYQRNVMTSLWGKLYRSSLFSGLKTTIGELYEDLDLFYRVALRARKVAYTPLPLYFYRQRDNSIIHTFTPDRLCVLDVTTRICNLLSEKYPALYDAAIDRRFSANYDMLRLINICLRNRTHNEKVGAAG